MITRFAVVIVLGIFLEMGVFAYVHRDTLALTTDWAIWDTGGDVFAERAERLLRHPAVTRKQVEQIASRARQLGMPSVEARALSVYAERDRRDTELRLRQADALRRAGDLRQAQRVYLELLNQPAAEVR